MEKLNAYIVMTNGAINIVTTDPNVADQAKMKSPGSIVKRFPLTSKMAGSTGLVGEALDGDFEMGADDTGSIDRDDVEFATDDQPQDGASMDDVEGDDDTTDVICMNTELAVRVFEYIAQNQIDSDELQTLADKMADLGNQSDDVLTSEHFDEITGGEQDRGDEFDDSEFGDDADSMEDGMSDLSDEQGNDDIAADLELGEADELISRTGRSMVNRHPRAGQTDLRNIPAGNRPDSNRRFSDEDRARYPGDVKASIRRSLGTHTRPNLPEDAYDTMDPHGRGSIVDDSDELEQDFDTVESHVSDADEQLIAQFIAGQIGREELIDGLSQGSQDDYAPHSDIDPYGDDVSGAFDDEVSFDDDEDLEEDMQQPQGTQPTQGTQQQQAPTQNPAQFDSAYINGYNTAKRGGQAQQQNINTPQGSAYNRGFMDAKANKPSVPPSKQQNESAVDSDEWYDNRGNVNPTGNYDAGGHYHVREGYNDGREYGGAGKGRSADATETARITAKAKAAAKKAGKTFDTSAQYRSWYSKQKKSATSGSVCEGVETFGAFLAAMEKKVDRTVAPTIATLFKAKKQKAADAEKHFSIEQDAKTSAVKVTNTSTVVPKR
jgi:hypothetical protein